MTKPMTKPRLIALVNAAYLGGTKRKFAPAHKAIEEIWAALKPARRKQAGRRA